MRKFLKIFVIALAVFAIAFSVFWTAKHKEDLSKISLIFPHSRINKVYGIVSNDQKEINYLATVQILLVRGTSVITGGSGFFINEDGYVLTCNHVIAQAIDDKDIRVLIVFQGHAYKSKIIDYDKMMDLGLLKVKTNVNLPFVCFGDSEKISANDQMIISAMPPNSNDLDGKIDFNKVEKIISPKHQILKPDEQSFFSDPQVKKFFERDADRGKSILDPEIREFYLNPNLIQYFQDKEILEFLYNPEIIKNFSGSKAEKLFQNLGTYMFFLTNQETRIFFTDPEKEVKPGCSGGACFDENGGCIGMIQEIYFSLRPEERSERGDYYSRQQYYSEFPQANSFFFFMLFPQIEVILGSGRSSKTMIRFLEENKIKFYQMEENK